MSTNSDTFKGNKEQLENLNNRLQSIFLRHRELDMERVDAEQAIRDAEERANQQLQQLRDSFKRQLDDLTKMRDEIRQESDDRAAQIRRLQSELDNLKGKSSDQEKRLEDVTARNEALTDRVRLQNSENARLTSQNEQNEKTARNLERMLGKCQNDFNKAQREADEAVRDKHQWKTKAKNLEQQYKRDKTSFEKELERLKTELEAVNVGEDDIERRIRQDMTDQLDNILAKKQGIHELEKTELAASLKKAYEGQLDKLRHDLLDMSESFQRAISERNRIDAEKDALKNTLDELAESNSTLMKRVDDLNEQLNQMRAQPRNDEKDKRISELQQLLFQKDAENEELLALKVRLFNEIKTYKRLLEGENVRFEQKRRRLGMPEIPLADSEELERVYESRPRRGESSAMGESSRGRDEDIPKSIFIAALDNDGSRISVGNGSGRNVSLAGWQIRLRSSRSRFTFPPAAAIAPNQIVDVWVGQGLIADEIPGNFYWTEDVYHDGIKSDMLSIVDADNQIADAVNIQIPQSGGCPIM